MTRRLRIHVPGGFYHATLRGNHRQAIFTTSSDRALLNAIVARTLKAHLARLHVYCWMTNHLHFFIQVGDVPLGVVMRDIASNYARAYQAKLDTTGHLFERRYYAKVVDVEHYLFAVLRYIHLNPVADGLVQRPMDYPWSSHRAYAGIEPPSDWLETDFVLSIFASGRRDAHLAYRRFMDQDVPDCDLATVDSGSSDILGGDDFTTRILNMRPSPRKSQVSLEELVSESCRRFEIAEVELLSSSRDGAAVKARAWVAHQALTQRAASLSQVARILGRDRATLRHAMRQYAAGLE